MSYTPLMPTKPNTPAIALDEYRARREKVLRSLKGAAAAVFAGEGSPPILGKWRPDASFVYLTGLEDEAGAAVLFDPTHEDSKRRCVLFLRPLNPEMERWDGYREQIGKALKDRTGFKTVMRSSALPAALTAAARRAKKAACLHPVSVYPAPPAADLEAFRKISERLPGLAIEDKTGLLPSLRALKSPAELALMRRAITATAEGFAAAARLIAPGVNENVIEQTLERTYRAHGADGLAFNSIVGSGLNSTVLHYMANKALLKDGDLLVIDAGASCAGYAADVTRTFPVSGRFAAEQREVYETVLVGQGAAIKAARVGAKMCDVDQAARKVIEKAGYGDAFIHGIGHQLGMEVHDVTPDGPLKAGMVVTVEPGVYLPDRKIGIRIEDDVLIQARGNTVLTAAIPKTVKAVEGAMGGR